MNEMNVANAMSGLAQQGIGRVQDTLSKPFDYSGMNPLQTSVQGGNINQGYDQGGNINYGYDAGGGIRGTYGSGGDIARGYDSGGDIQRQLGGAGDITGTYGSGGNINYGYGSGGQIQGQMDYSGLQDIPGLGDFGGEAKRAQEAVYGQATSRLDPQFEQQQRQLATQLAGKGVSENSEAYRRAMDQFSRQKTDAYNQANYSSIAAGGQEQSRLFGLAMGARQQGAGERQFAGQFANQAQQQGEQQAYNRSMFGNTAQQQAEAQAAARGAFANQSQQQRFGQEATRGQFANQAQSQAEQQNAARAGFSNEAQSQANQQSALEAAFANQAQNQQNVQNQAAATFGNTAQGQANSQNAAQAAFGNQAQQQQFGQNQWNAQFGNQARQQQIAEATALRNMPLNDIAALLGTGGVQNPQFADYKGVTQAGVDYGGMVQNNFSNQMQLYQQQMAQRNAMMGSIFGLAGSGAGLAFSDRRLKDNIKAIGKLANGIKTYVFNYIGDRYVRFGVMADDVFGIRPEAVAVHPSGYMMVDYGKVW